jgi:uncharacterized membrane protein
MNPLNAELNPFCHLLALLGGATIVVVSRLRVNRKCIYMNNCILIRRFCLKLKITPQMRN